MFWPHDGICSFCKHISINLNNSETEDEVSKRVV